jgi:hypothetical protein
MVASDDKYMTSAVETVFLTNEDKNAIKVAREREDFLRSQAYKDAKLKEQAEYIEKLSSDYKKMSDVVAEKDIALAEKNTVLAAKNARIKELEAELAKLKG